MALDHRTAGAGGGGKALAGLAGLAGATALGQALPDDVADDPQAQQTSGSDPAPSDLDFAGQGPWHPPEALPGGGGTSIADSAISGIQAAGAQTAAASGGEIDGRVFATGDAPIHVGNGPMAPSEILELPPDIGGRRQMAPMELLQGLYDEDMPDSTFRDIQEELYVAGYYGDVEPDAIAWGDKDDTQTFGAWKSFVESAATFTAESGIETSWDDLLAKEAEAGRASGHTLEGPQQPRVYQTSDPVALGKTLDEAAKRTIGREIDAEHKRAFVAGFHEAQRAAQDAAYDARESGGTAEATQPRADARAEQMVERQFQDEAQAHGAVQQIDALLQMIGG